MNPMSVILTQYGTVVQPGTGTDFRPGYEPDFPMLASCRAISAGGTVVAHVQGSDVVGSGYTSIGSATFHDAAGGTTVKAIDVDARSAVNRYHRSLITVVGGTATGGVSTHILARPRTM